MKNLFILLIILLLSGCCHLAEQSEFGKHKSIYASGGHAVFSIFGYRNPTVEDAKNAKAQGWWGIPVEVKSADRR
ncbi:MAG TPA: hypothetical protein VF343_00115 [Syntrophales bacterium]